MSGCTTRQVEFSGCVHPLPSSPSLLVKTEGGIFGLFQVLRQYSVRYPFMTNAVRVKRNAGVQDGSKEKRGKKSGIVTRHIRQMADPKL